MSAPDLAAWGRAWSADTVDDLLAFHTPDTVYTDVGSDLTFHGHDELRGFFDFMLRFAPDGLIEFHEAHGDDAGFAATWTWSGTAAGKFKVGDTVHPATGKRFSVPGVAFCTTTPDGLIKTHRDYWDVHAVLVQLGLA